MTTQFLTREGGRIAYDDTGGAGPLVVCLPGMGDRRQLFRRFTPYLVDAGYRVVTMDLRGHGESSTGWATHTPVAVGQDLLALLRQVEPAGPAAVVAVSFSPAAAIWAAAETPELISGLVLVSPWAHDPTPSRLTRLLAGLVGRSPRGWAWFYRSLHRTPPPDLPAYLQALRRNLAEPGRSAALRAMMWAPKAEGNDRLPEVRCPVLVAMGSQDPDFPDPAAEAEQVARRARQAEVVMLDGVGHYPPSERPDLLAASVLPFLARTTRDE